MAPDLYTHKAHLLADPHRPLRGMAMAGTLLLGLFLLLGFQSAAGAHGGKIHKDNRISAFTALQTAMNLYDRLLTHDKLDESWETDLVRIKIIQQDSVEEGGYTVSFERSSGEPGTVYFFLTPTGEYAGSNFTGP